MQGSEDLPTLVNQASNQFYRLVLLVGPHGSGKTAVLTELSDTLQRPRLNLNLELATQLLDLSPSRRPTRVGRLFNDLVGCYESPVLLDNIEQLFDPQLQVNPLRLLQEASRSRTLVVSWCGVCDKERLVYAEAGHPEYKEYEAGQIQVFNLTGSRSNAVL